MENKQPEVKKKVKKFPVWLHYGLFLFGLGLVVGALLMGMYMLTKPQLERLKLQKFKPLLESVAPGKLEDTWESKTDKTLNKNIQYVYLSKDKKYYAFIVKTQGYQNGDITTFVAFDDTDKLVSIKNVSHEKQTKGIGDQIVDFDFKLVGVSADKLRNLTKDSKELETISGATYSSRAVLEAAIIASQGYWKLRGK